MNNLPHEYNAVAAGILVFLMDNFHVTFSSQENYGLALIGMTYAVARAAWLARVVVKHYFPDKEETK